MKVQLIFDHIGHHAGHSGYDQMLRYLTGRIPVEQLQMFPASGAAEWVWQRMINHSGVGWYGHRSAGMETAAALRILRGKGEIYHFLYGENDFRYLGYVRRVMGRRRGAVVSSYHQPPEVFERVVTARAMLRDLDVIMLVSRNQIPCFSAFAGPQTKIEVVPHGVDTEYFCPLERKPTETITCLCVGQWLRDFEMLRKVAAEVALKNPRIRFLVTGSGKAGDPLRAAPNVTVAGRLSDDELLTAYQTSDIMVLPIIDSTANNALLEGMSCGLPMVTTDVGGMRDYVDESCAWLHPSGDVDGMTATVLRLADDEALRALMGARARERALTFRWENVASQLIGIYKGLAG